MHIAFMHTFSDIFEAFGGTGGIKSAVGVESYQTVASWKRRGIPRKVWPDLLIAAAEADLPLAMKDLIDAEKSAAESKAKA